MHLRRRILALLCMLATLHLTVAADVRACVSHATPPAQPVAAHAATPASHEVPAAHGAMHGEGAAERPAAASVSEAPCAVPTSTSCCDALAECAAYSALCVARSVAASPGGAAGRLLATPHDAPASFAMAPEPPPPKG